MPSSATNSNCFDPAVRAPALREPEHGQREHHEPELREREYRAPYPPPDGDSRAPQDGDAVREREHEPGGDGDGEGGALAPAGTARASVAARERDARRAALLVGTPREVLARIVPHDELRVRDVVARVLGEDCLFLDADRVHLRALARIARAALRYAPSGLALDDWLAAETRAAAGEILREEAEAPRADPGSAYAQFARPLGLDPEALRRGCAAFHRLPHADRAAFCALFVQGLGLEAHARATGEPPLELARRARRGLDAVLHASHPDLPPPARTAAGLRPKT